MDERDKLMRDAVLTAGDRQRALDEVCRSVLAPFIGRKITPTAVAEAEAAMRAALIDAIRAGKYVLPDGLTLDRVELGPNMRLQVYFNKAPAPAPAAKTKLMNRYEAVAAEIDNNNDDSEEEPT